MTRKRFIRLMMAEGFSRNEADAWARDIARTGGTYAGAYERYNASSYDLDDISKALREVAKAAALVTAALTAGFAAFNKAYREAMEAETSPNEHEKSRL